MSGYIKREDAMAAVDKCRCDTFQQLNGMKGYLNAILPADVVEVVRCKDCKFNNAKDKNKGVAACGLMVDVHNADDYCSYGERMDGEEE